MTRINVRITNAATRTNTTISTTTRLLLSSDSEVGSSLGTVLEVDWLVVGTEGEQTGEGMAAASSGAQAGLSTSSIPAAVTELWKESHSCSVALSSISLFVRTDTL